jgi:uncharacterized protein (DUF983 family)
MSTDLSTQTTLLRGMMLRCPNCGIGKLFKSYLKAQDECPHCHESFKDIRTDDGSASPAIFLTSLIVVPLVVFLGLAGMADWLVMAIALTATVVFALLLLPPCKGFFIAAIWLMHKRHQKPNTQP